MPLLRLPVTISPKPGNDGGPKEIHPLFCRHDRAVYHPDPVVSTLMEKRFDHERHEKSLQDKSFDVDFGETPEIDE